MCRTVFGNSGQDRRRGKRLIEKGYTTLKFHAISHRRGSEAEAINRLIIFAEPIDQPIIIGGDADHG